MKYRLLTSMRSLRFVRYSSTMKVGDKVKLLATAIKAVENSTPDQSGSLLQVKLQPESYIGLHTKYGWGLLPKWLYGKDTLKQINLLLIDKFGETSKVDKLQVQLAIDQWITSDEALMYIDNKRKVGRPKKEDAKSEEEKPFHIQATRYITKELEALDSPVTSIVELTFPDVDKDVDECLRLYHLKLRKLTGNLPIDYKDKTPHPHLPPIDENDVGEVDYVDPTTGKKVSYSQGYRYFWAYHIPRFKGVPGNVSAKFIAYEWSMCSQADRNKFTHKYVQLLQKGISLLDVINEKGGKARKVVPQVKEKPLAKVPSHKVFEAHVEPLRAAPDYTGIVEVNLPGFDVDSDAYISLCHRKLRELPADIHVDYSQASHPTLEYIDETDVSEADLVNPQTGKKLLQASGHRYFLKYNEPQFSDWPSETAAEFLNSEWLFLSAVDKMKFTYRYVQLLEKGLSALELTRPSGDESAKKYIPKKTKKVAAPKKDERALKKETSQKAKVSSTKNKIVSS